MLQAICAASMAIVPLPQQGSYSGSRSSLAIGPAAGGDHGGGQRFLQRRIALVFAPAALEQRLARGVDVEREAVGGQVGVDAHIGPLGVHIRAHAAALSRKRSQTASLILSAAKFRLVSGLCCAVTSTLMLCLRREPDFPRHLAGGAVQVLLVAVLGVATAAPARAGPAGCAGSAAWRRARRRRSQHAAARGSAGPGAIRPVMRCTSAAR